MVSEKNNRLIQIAEAYNEAVSEYRSGDMKNVREPVKGIYYSASRSSSHTFSGSENSTWSRKAIAS